MANIIALALQKQNNGETAESGADDGDGDHHSRPNSLDVNEPLPLPPRREQR